MPKKIDPALRAAAVEAVRAGASTRAVSDHILDTTGERITHVTIARWVNEAPPAAPSPTPAAAPPLPAAPAGPVDEVATLEQMSADALERARKAEAAGHFDAAASFMRQATTLAPVIRRAKAAANADGDTVKYSRADIDAAIEGVLARVAALTARPLLCAKCGRELSVAIGHGAPPATNADRGQDDHTEKPGGSRKA